MVESFTSWNLFFNFLAKIFKNFPKAEKVRKIYWRLMNYRITGCSSMIMLLLSASHRVCQNILGLSDLLHFDKPNSTFLKSWNFRENVLWEKLYWIFHFQHYMRRLDPLRADVSFPSHPKTSGNELPERIESDTNQNLIKLH